MADRVLLINDMRTGEPKPLAQVSAQGTVTFGREEGVSIVINSKAVSRQHGDLQRLGGNWLYRDTGSTNGSWINGVQVKPNVFNALRDYDTLQLADTLLLVREFQDHSGELVPLASTEISRSILIYNGESFINEVSVPEYGRAVTVGGPGGILEIEGRMSNAPILSIERRGVDTSIVLLSSDTQVFINGNPLTAAAILRDGDQIAISTYVITYFDSVARTPSPALAKSTAGSSTSWLAGREWSTPEGRAASDKSAERRPTHTGVFGRVAIEKMLSEAAGDEMVQGDNQRRKSSTQLRHLLPLEEPQQGTLEGLEDKLIVVLGGLLMVTLLVLILLWFFV